MPRTGVEYATDNITIYRSCPYRCHYCVPKGTRVLTADFEWVPIEKLDVGDTLIAFDERPLAGNKRRLRIAKVSSIIALRKPVYRIETDKGVICSTGEHAWLVKYRSRNGSFWRKTEKLREGLRILYFIEPTEGVNTESPAYLAGYVAGLVDGDGTYRITPSGLRHEKSCYLRVAMTDIKPLMRLKKAFRVIVGIDVSLKPHKAKSKKQLLKVETWSGYLIEDLFNEIRRYERKIEFAKGYLAGIFDSDGSTSRNYVRLVISKDEDIIEKVLRYCSMLGYEVGVEKRGDLKSILLYGELKDRIRFFLDVKPANTERAIRYLVGKFKVFDEAEILSIKRVNELVEVYDITTSTSTFFADGFASHNCWAWRLPLFRSRISRGKYDPLTEAYRYVSAVRPRIIVISFTSDPYPPEEREKRLTGKVLRALAGSTCPHRVMILTKNPKLALELDKDVLTSRRRVSFWLGSTVICLKKTDLEPKAPSPSERLEALREAYGMGITTWLSIEPIIPHVTKPEEIIERTCDYVDLYVLGSFNYSRQLGFKLSSHELRMWYASHAFKAIELAKQLNKRIILKKELARMLREIFSTPTLDLYIESEEVVGSGARL